MMVIIFSKWLNSSIWPIDGNQIGTTTPGHNGPESDGSEGVLHILQTPGLEPHHQMQFSVNNSILK